MPYLELPGMRLWFEDSGINRAPIIFLHAASFGVGGVVY